MAAIEERKNKKGEVVSYRFRVSLGYDVHGKQVTKQKTWKPLPNMTKTQIKKELNKQAQLFEMECMQGQCVDDNITFKQHLFNYFHIICFCIRGRNYDPPIIYNFQCSQSACYSKCHLFHFAI